jgi:adenylate cyclase class IV
MSLLEVEQKFQLTDSGDLESRLNNLGFVPKDTSMFVDWYFDTEKNYLSTQDCWLRFREKGGKGRWELKRGRGHTSSTVYEESEGEEAISIALSLAPETAKSDFGNNEFDGFEAPKLPIDESHGLFPFCRLETTRSSWIVDPKVDGNIYAGLGVDLDATNTGHSVGEVETVVETDGEVLEAKARVEALIAKLTENSGSDEGPAVGKIEHFLMNYRPEHYDACVKSGVMQEKRQN